MKKEFYTGQPLLDKETGEQVTFVYDDRWRSLPCNVLRKVDGEIQEDYYDYEDLEPTTEFTFSEILVGLEHGYFEAGTEFRMLNTDRVIIVEQGIDGLYVQRPGELLFLTSREVNSTWQLVEPRKKMTLEEIEAELGYKIKLK